MSLKLEVEAASGVADSGDPEQDLADLVREIGEVAQTAGSGALFLIDEMHNLDSDSLAAICIAFQAVSRAGLPVAMAAAGLPDLLRLGEALGDRGKQDSARDVLQQAAERANALDMPALASDAARRLATG